MCQARAEGGRRCAAHTRPAFQSALDAVNSATSKRAQMDARVAGMEAVAFHAATPTGATEVAALLEEAERAGDTTLVSVLRTGQNMAEGINDTYAQVEAEIAAREAGQPVPEPVTLGAASTPPEPTAEEKFRASADTAGRVRIEEYNVNVHPRSRWPITYLRSMPYRTATIAPETPVHTTQRDVYADNVLAKGDGSDGVVTVALQKVPGGQRIWIVDGHHTLVAARRNGLPVTAEVHQAGSGDPIDPPRLYTRRSAPDVALSYDAEFPPDMELL